MVPVNTGGRRSRPLDRLLRQAEVAAGVTPPDGPPFFFAIPWPLVFQAHGLRHTSVGYALTYFAVLAALAPFFRCLLGMLLRDTGGSIVAVGLMHGSLNAAGAMPVLQGAWQHIPAVVLLTLGLCAARAWSTRLRCPPSPGDRRPDARRARRRSLRAVVQARQEREGPSSSDGYGQFDASEMVAARSPSPRPGMTSPASAVAWLVPGRSFEEADEVADRVVAVERVA
jgi:hypothetical protein